MSNGSPPKKRRKIAETPDMFQTFTFPPPPTPLRGKAFTDGIKNLAGGGNGTVYTQLDIPYTRTVYEEKSKALPKPRQENASINNHGTFSVSVQQSDEGRKIWTQGMLTPMGETSYFDDNKKGRTVPSTMTMKTATIESRAMKFLAMDGSQYTPKNDGILSERKGATEAKKTSTKANPSGVMEESHHWGGLALGSYLEEITAQRGLGFQSVGSAMRAMTMASKWRMKQAKTDNEPGFGDKMLTAFPQLGKKDMLPKNTLGASALWNQLNKGDPTRQQTLDHHLGFGGSIYKAHVEARTAAKEVFASKLDSIITSGDSSGHGKWWGNKALDPSFMDLGKTENVEKRNELRAEYVKEKMDRHGIVNVPGPTRWAKHVAKEQTVKAGFDKAVDPTGYTKYKRDYVDNMLKGANFVTQATKAQVKWARKDNFDRKLEEHLSSGGEGKGNWWKTKIGAGAFKSLDDAGRKALRQEYVAYRKAKGK